MCTSCIDTLSVTQRIAIGHGETYFDLLSLIASRVGQDGSTYLLELTRNQDPRVVNAAITTLGRLKLDDASVQRLTQIASANSNETIREHATLALLNSSTDPALATSTWRKKAFDDGYRVMAIEWWGKHTPDEARAKCLRILHNPDSEPLRIAAIRVLGQVKDKADDESVFQALVKIAQETSYGARNAAIRSLAQLGNKAAISFLQPITTHAPNGIKGAATAAIEQLNKG